MDARVFLPLLLKSEATSVPQEIRLYNTFDAEDADEDYYAFILAQKNPKAFQSEIYYRKCFYPTRGALHKHALTDNLAYRNLGNYFQMSLLHIIPGFYHV